MSFQDYNAGKAGNPASVVGNHDDYAKGCKDAGRSVPVWMNANPGNSSYGNETDGVGVLVLIVTGVVLYLFYEAALFFWNFRDEFAAAACGIAALVTICKVLADFNVGNKIFDWKKDRVLVYTAASLLCGCAGAAAVGMSNPPEGVFTSQLLEHGDWVIVGIGSILWGSFFLRDIVAKRPTWKNAMKAVIGAAIVYGISFGYPRPSGMYKHEQQTVASYPATKIQYAIVTGEVALNNFHLGRHNPTVSGHLHRGDKVSLMDTPAIEMNGRQLVEVIPYPKVVAGHLHLYNGGYVPKDTLKLIN
jgi:hypothetical protein